MNRVRVQPNASSQKPVKGERDPLLSCLLQLAYLACVVVGFWLFFQILDALPVLKLILALLVVISIGLGLKARIDSSRQRAEEEKAFRVLEFPEEGGLLAVLNDQPASGRLRIPKGERTRLSIYLSWGGDRPDRAEMESAVEPFCKVLRRIAPSAIDEVSVVAGCLDKSQQGVLGERFQQAILEAISARRGLQVLELGGDQWAPGLKVKPGPGLSQVRGLFMAGSAPLLTLLPCFKELREFQVSLFSNAGNAHTIRATLRSLETCSELEDLSITGCPDIDWLPRIRPLTKLRSLTLGEMKSVSGQGRLLRELGAARSLRTLSLPFWPQPPELFLESGVLAQLAFLRIPFPRSRPAELFRLLGEVKNVRELTDLGGVNEPYPSGFCEALASIPSLGRLELHDLEFTDDLRRLLEIPSLQELNLYCSNRASVPEFPGWERPKDDSAPWVVDLLEQLAAKTGRVCLRRVTASGGP